MPKNKFGVPTIISSLTPGGDDGEIIGGGTGTGVPGSGDDGNPDYADYMDFDAWFELYGDQDFNNDGLVGTEEDWLAWLDQNGYEIPKP